MQVPKLAPWKYQLGEVPRKDRLIAGIELAVKARALRFLPTGTATPGALPLHTQCEIRLLSKIVGGVIIIVDYVVMS